MCRIEDAESWAFFAASERTCRKPRRCVECHRMIKAGERYHYEGGKMDGHFEFTSTCQHCDSARQWLMVACHGWIYGEVLEELKEHWEESETFRSKTLLKLILGMRRRWWEGDMAVIDKGVVRESVPTHG